MKQLRILAGEMLCLGVLLGGVGTGIAFGEFSSLTYKRITVGEASFETENYTCSLEEAEDTFQVLTYANEVRKRLETDEDIPADTVEVSVVYNSQVCQPGFWSDANRLVVDVYGTGNSHQVEYLMKWKDQVLEGLREGELRDYQAEWLQSITCRVNPADVEKVILR